MNDAGSELWREKLDYEEELFVSNQHENLNTFKLVSETYTGWLKSKNL
jgi:hypothetical protein